MKAKFQKVMMISILSFMTGCSSSSNDSKEKAAGGGQPGNNSIAWESISSEFNPRIEESYFKVDRIEKVEMDLFGFSDDVRVSYSDKIAADEGQLKIYTVFKRSASFGNLNTARNGKKVSLTKQGEYKCSIQIKNGQIQDLDGGCFIRIELVLPVNAEVEVYNLRSLLTKRFILVDNVTFLKNLNDVNRDDDKLAVVEDYLDSYKALKKTPSLAVAELKAVLESLLRGENQLTVLRKLNSYVAERDQLRTIIEQVFSYFDREEAYKICGV